MSSIRLRRIQLRFHLGFTDQPAHERPRIELFLERPVGSAFELTPIQLGERSRETQWHVRSSGPFRCSLFTGGSGVSLALDQPLQLDVGRIDPDVIDPRPFLVHAGSLHVRIDNNSLARTHLSRFWPTQRRDDLIAFHATGSGFFLEGHLPSLFFPEKRDSTGTGRNRVVLRLPQPGDPYERPWKDVCRIFFPGPQPSPPSWVWQLTNLSEAASRESRTAGGYLKEFGERLRTLHLEGADNRTATFIDEVDIDPPETGVGFIFVNRRTVAPPRTPLDIGWIFTSIKTRIAIGGGAAGEANFFPQYLIGRLSRPQATAPWARVHLRLESIPQQTTRPDLFGNPSGPPPGSEPSSLQLELAPGQPQHPLSVVLTETRLQILAGGFSTEDLAAVREDSPSAWLALRRGWLQLRAPAKHAILDVERVKDGAIREVIDLRSLASSLGIGSAAGGLDLQVQALGESSVFLVLEERTHAATPKLTLQILAAMITATTSGAWFRSRPGFADVPPRIADILDQADLASAVQPVDPDRPDDTLEQRLQELERTLRDRFGSARFVSENVTTQPVTGGQPLTAAIAFDSAKDEGFLFRLVGEGEGSLMYWHLPRGLPVVNSASLRPGQQPKLAPDGTRGLVRYRCMAPSLVLRFPGRGLPFPQRRVSDGAGGFRWVDDEPVVFEQISGSWELAVAEHQSFFLPTVPGIEMREETPGEPGGVVWIYRHAVPALDEWFATAKEAPDGASELDSGMGSGIEGTRVIGADVFRLDGSGERFAVGWLPQTEDTRGNGVPGGRVAVDPGDWKTGLTRLPRNPAVVLRLRDGLTRVDRVIGRLSYVEGVSLDVEVGFTWREDRLPLVVAHLAGAVEHPDGVVVVNGAIRRGGQQLFVTELQGSGGAESIYTFDGEGRLREEPTGTLDRYGQVGQEGQLVEGVYRTERVDVVPGQVVLELITTGVGQSPSPGGYHPGWTLHDGHGDWAQIAGFPLFPLTLQLADPSPIDDPELTGIVRSVWEPVMPVLDGRERPRHGRGLVALAYRRTEAGYEPLRLSGEIDWRLPEPHTVDGTYLVRISAVVDHRGSEDGFGSAVVLSDVRLELRHPVGTFQVELPDRWTAEIRNGRLTVRRSPGPADTTTIAEFSFEPPADEFGFEVGRTSPLRLPGTSFVWTFALAGAGLGIRLRYTEPEQAGLAWHLEVTQESPEGDVSTLVDVGLQGSPSSLRQFLFHVDESAEGRSDWPQSSWFRPRHGMTPGVILGVEFQNLADGPKRIAGIAGEILWLLGGRADDPWGDEMTRVAFQLSVGRSGIRSTVSGSLGVRNRIRFVCEGRRGGDQELEHRMVIHLDRVALPLSAVLQGQAIFSADDERPAGMVIDHYLFDGDDAHRWQCAQIVRWTNLGNYADRYLSLQDPIPEEDRSLLVLDAGVALALAAESKALPTPPVPDIEYDDLRLGLTASAGGLRGKRPVVLLRLPSIGAPEPILPDPPWSIRIPAIGDGTPCELPGALCLEGGLGPQWPVLATSTQPAASDSGILSLVNRSQLTEWLSSDLIARLAFVAAEQDGGSVPLASKLRLAFVKPGTETIWHKLPDQLGDFGPLLGSNRETNIRWYQAAMLVTPYVPGGPGQVMTRARILDFPYVVGRVADSSIEKGEGIRVELAMFAKDRRDDSLYTLRVIASQEIRVGNDLEGAVLRWARGQIRDRDRSEGALALTREYVEVEPGSFRLRVAVRPIPRLFDAIRRELAEEPVWAGVPTLRGEVSRVLPTVAAGPGSPATRTANPALGLLAFNAAPAGDESTGNSLPPATRFRLTHLGTSEGADHGGRLRPAVAGNASPDAARVLSFSKWDQVPFEVHVAQPTRDNGSGAFLPAPSQAAVLHRPSAINPADLSRRLIADGFAGREELGAAWTVLAGEWICQASLGAVTASPNALAVATREGPQGGHSVRARIDFSFFVLPPAATPNTARLVVDFNADGDYHWGEIEANSQGELTLRLGKHVAGVNTTLHSAPVEAGWSSATSFWLGIRGDRLLLGLGTASGQWQWVTTTTTGLNGSRGGMGTGALPEEVRTYFREFIFYEEDAELDGIVPPLFDVVASVSRPGEMTRTIWSLSDQRAGRILGLATGSAAVVGLRRPRSRAGARQSVRLRPVPGVGRPMVDGRYFFVALGLTQIIDETPEPEPTKCKGVLTCTDRIARSHSDAAAAETAPALVGYRVEMQEGSETKVLDRCALYLVASGLFRPERRSRTGELLAKTVLFWSESETPPETLGELPQEQIILSTVPPPANAAGWEEHGASSWLLRVEEQVLDGDTSAADRLDKAIQALLLAEDGVFLFAWTFETPDAGADPPIPEDDWVPVDPETPVFALKVQAFDRGSTVRMPAIVYSLLSERRAVPEDLTCGGHGALFDEQFSPITPRPVGRTLPSEDTPTVNLEWSRKGQLVHAEPIRFQTDAEEERDPYLFDVVAYGHQGELFRTDEPPQPSP